MIEVKNGEKQVVKFVNITYSSQRSKNITSNESDFSLERAKKLVEEFQFWTNFECQKRDYVKVVNQTPVNWRIY